MKQYLILILCMIFINGCSTSQDSIVITPTVAITERFEATITPENQKPIIIEDNTENSVSGEVTINITQTPELEMLSNEVNAENAGEDILLEQDTAFTLENIDKVAPDDVVREIAYFAGLGGGSSDCRDYDVQKPELVSVKEKVEVMYNARFLICGIGIGEPVSVEIELPDDSIRTFNLTSYQAREKNSGEIEFFYLPDYKDPKGNYRFVFKGNNWEIDQKIEVIDSDVPRLYFVDNEKLILYKFKPQESVRVLAYMGDNHDKLAGWKKYFVDENGELIIDSDLDANFVAIGEQSGQFLHSVPGEISPWAWLGSGDFSCPGANRPIGIDPSKYAEVIVDQLSLFNQPEENFITEITKGTILRFESNPICKGDSWWWAVWCSGNQKCSGWVKEFDRGNETLKSLQELPPTPTIAPQPLLEPYHPIPECAASRIQIGMAVELIDWLSFRNAPDAHDKNNKIGRLEVGDVVTVIGGPECSYQWIMWKVRTQDGREGWIAESDGNQFWLKSYGYP